MEVNHNIKQRHCDICGLHVDEPIFSGINGKVYCPWCAERCFIFCAYCDDIICNTKGIYKEVFDDSRYRPICDKCLEKYSDRFKQCKKCNEYYHIDYLKNDICEFYKEENNE